MHARLVALGAFLALSTTGCFMFGGMGMAARTPLPDAEVQELTTCETGDLSAIKKNLMLSGYSIENVDDETIVTDFKQTSTAYGGGKEFLKIIAVKVDDARTKFKVRVRTESLDTMKTGELKDSSGRTIATDSTVVENKNEVDEAYFVEMKDQYAATKREVCGT